MTALYDQHTHSHHSIDSETPPRANVEAALAAGLVGVTFTEHFDTHPDEWDTCRYDEAAYSRDLAELRAAFRERTFVGKGIEICHQPGRWQFILDFLAQHEFDLVILSVHWTERGPIHERAWWEQFRTLEQAIEHYIRTVRQAAEDAERAAASAGARVFDVLGHFDLVKRYTLRLWGEVAPPCDAALLDETLATCIAADLTPEINTSLLRQGGGEPMPGLEVLARYRAAGGDAVSLGSDAHLAEHVGADFDRALGLVRQAGLEAIALYEARKRRKVSLA